VPLQCLSRDSVTLISTLLLTYLLTCVVVHDPLIYVNRYAKCDLLLHRRPRIVDRTTDRIHELAGLTDGRTDTIYDGIGRAYA